MKSNHKSLIKIALIFVVLAGCAILLWKLMVTRETVREGIQYITSFGFWSYFVFGLIYVVLASLSFPSSVFNIAAGVLFSFKLGLLVAAISALTAACITFLISRYMLKEFVTHRIEATKSGKQILKLVAEHSAKFIFMLRLNPFIPAVVKNYGLGVTHVKLRTYVWTTMLGQLPLTAMYVYLGWIGGLAMLNQDNSPETVHWLVLGGGLAISIVTLVLSHFYMRKYLSSNQPAQEAVS
ncbi:TVP38/TMEM64 family protein [Alteromonas ponticola]|uniref:TVP38/TMEM64 family membrane protein n=1 Tax=Alteromonas ponticola TaxID=2720613 RepID=A0ABX1QXN4_9ALTE|nr:VTT domain-containing protein [Alteromonas ponticola]NMH59013.1 TVP38/TMEM64 family protein [Alteromonas ponticola]